MRGSTTGGRDLPWCGRGPVAQWSVKRFRGRWYREKSGLRAGVGREVSLMGIDRFVRGRIGGRFGSRRVGRFGILVLGVVALAGGLTGCDTTPVLLQGTVTTTVGSNVGAVTVELYADTTETLVTQAVTDGVGAYRFQQSAVTDGTYRVRINGQWWPAGATWADAASLALTAATATTADMVLVEQASLSGTIVNGASPAAGVLVGAMSSGGVTVASVVTAADGSFTLGVLDPAAVTVHLFDFPVGVVVNVGGSTATTFTTGLGDNLHIGTIEVTTGLPVPVPTTAIATGGNHTCAVAATGTVSCWGRNDDGQLGNGTTTDATTPVAVTGITDATAVAAGARHTCALAATGTVSCWGRNDYGQLGNGTTTSATTPVAVAGITNAVAVAAGGYHTCALAATGTVSCWGGNGYGQIGNGTTNSATTPVAVAGITDATAIAVGAIHTCALADTGTVSCWGSNISGQLGNGTTTRANTPVAVAGL